MYSKYMHFSEDLWKLLKILSAKYSVWKMWSFFEYVVSIRHPDDLEVIKHCPTKFDFFLSMVCGVSFLEDF